MLSRAHSCPCLDRMSKSSSKASNKASSLHARRREEVASRDSSPHAERIPWRPESVRVYTDEERLEGKRIKDWIQSTLKNEPSKHTCAKLADVADAPEIAKTHSDLELEGQYQALEDYLNPTMITIKFFKLDMQAVRTIRHLEIEMREAAIEATEDKSLKIDVVDKTLLGPGHSMWAEMDEDTIRQMNKSEKKHYHELALREIVFLRAKTTELQRLIFERKAALKKGEDLETFLFLWRA